MHNELKKDFEEHGYEQIHEELGTVTFQATKKTYKKKVNKSIHAKHPIWFDDDSKNFPGALAVVRLSSICARCNKPIVEGECLSCHRQFGTANRKTHIPWPHELQK